MSVILETQPYKGTRDFYPDSSIPGTYDFRKRDYIFTTWRKVLRLRGFVEYDSSVLENAEIYIAKSGQELGGSQLYNFQDKGGRHIALRPEMTPTLARMVANKERELKFPIRWFSIPNCFRYEKPQKGRLREHWQLNVDLVGLPAGEAELEILVLLGRLFQEFGADARHFKIMYNHRQVLDKFLQSQRLFESKEIIYKTLDDWYKVESTVKKDILSNHLDSDSVDLILDLGNHQGQAWQEYQAIAEEYPELVLIRENLAKIHPNLEFQFTPTIIRGIAYYTGLVLEAFDKNPANPRALFGGGRYDDLLDLFGKHQPAVGFGWGDLTMHEFLQGHGLYPDLDNQISKVGIIPLSPESLSQIFRELVPELEKQGKTCDINYEYSRSENKRRQVLHRRGCGEILTI